MTYIITAINFDCSLDDEDWTESDTVTTEEHLNSVYVGTEWDVTSEDELLDAITDKTGWCITHCEYKLNKESQQ